MATLKEQIETLERTWVLVGTNEGTYGPAAAQKATGSGDPTANNWRIYESVGTGHRRLEGIAMGDAPGYARWFGSAELSAKRTELERMRAEFRKIKVA